VWNGVSDGFAYGNADQLGDQALAAATAPVYAFGATFVILQVVRALMRLRVTEQGESLGLDTCEHGEEAYASGEGAILVTTEGEVREPVLVGQP
jgi:Amt family ammonium transporter